MLRGDVAVAPAAVAVAGEAQDRALGRDRAVLDPAPAGLADRRAELDVAADQVDREVAVVLGGADEVVAPLPAHPVAGVRVLDLERLARADLEDRVVAQREDLAGRAVAGAEDLALDQRRVGRGQAGADRRGAQRVDLRGVRVARAAAAGGGRVRDPAAQPVQALAGDRRDRGARRQLELDRAGAVVEAAREVLEHGRRRPLVVALGDLPGQRRVLGVHAGAARLRGLHVDLDDQPVQRVLEADVERVVDLRRRAERELVGALRARLAVGHADVLGRLAGALEHVRGRAHRGDREVLVDLEDDRLVVGGPRRADLGLAAGDQDRLGRRVREPEAQARGRGARPVEPDAEQVQQRDVQLVRHAVEPVDRHLRHPREQLDQRDAGVRDVVLGPLGARAGDPRARLGDEILEAAIVELDLGKPHSISSAGMT